jgi:hypothetical protein
MAIQLQAPSPFGHDPTAPPFSVIEAEDPQPVRDEPIGEDVAAIRRRFHNTSMPDAPGLQLSMAEMITVAGDNPRVATEERLLRLMGKLKLYYRTFRPRAGEPPSGIEFLDKDLGIEAPADKDIRPSFAGISDLEEDVERLIVFTLELLADPPRDSDPPLAVGVTIDPPIGLNVLHGYVAKCTTSAWASVRATAGAVRLRVTRSGVTVGLTTDSAGGGGSKTVGASTNTKATFDAAVRGLESGSYYKISTGWIRGSGGGCP